MIKERLEEDFKNALKEKDDMKVGALRMLKAAITNKEKEKRYKLSKTKPGIKAEEIGKESAAAKELERESALTDEEISDVIMAEIKKRKEAIVLYEKGKREDLAKKERAEAEVLKVYLPEQIGEEEIKKLAEDAVKKTGAKEIKDMGRVMKELAPKIRGRAEGGEVSRIVRELLSK